MESLYAQAQDFLKQKIGQSLRNPEVRIRKFGRRTQLPACSHSPQLHLMQSGRNRLLGGRVSIVARCNAPFWKIFLSATIKGDLPTVVATRVIPRKTAIGENAVMLRYLPSARRPAQAIGRLDAVIGLQARRNIGEGEIITARMLLPPYWVKRHKPVTLVTRIGAIEVRTTGIAQQDGVENDAVSVKNSRSGKTVRGIVVAPDTVLIP